MSTGPVRRQPFDAFEVARVGEYNDPGAGNYFERDDSRDYAADEECLGTIITLYGHRTWPDAANDPPPELIWFDDATEWRNGIPVTNDNAADYDAWRQRLHAADTDGYGLTAIADFEDNEDGRNRAIDLAHALAGAQVDTPVYIYLPLDEEGNA